MPRNSVTQRFTRPASHGVLPHRRRRNTRPNRPRNRSSWRRLQIEYLEARIVLSFDPSGLEQEMFQLVNRFRTDPQAELSLLVDRLNPISSPKADINQQLVSWGVDGNVLATQWQTLQPAPPLAWNEAVYDAAHVHTQAMIAHDDQKHEFPDEGDTGERLHDARYSWRRWAENIYAYPRSILEAHAGFVIDWGEGPHGIQDPPVHRNNLISPKYVHIGIAITEVNPGATRNVGPLVVTQDLTAPLIAGDAYVVGAVFQQWNDSPYYVNGLGYGGVTVVFEGTAGRFETTSMSAGGYQLALPPGTYRGTASGGRLPATLVSQEFVMGTQNVAIDFRYPDDQPVQPATAEDIVATYRDVPVNVAVLTNDQGSRSPLETESLEITTPPVTGIATISGSESGVIQYVPAQGGLGPDQFFYRVRNTDGVWSEPTRVRVLVLDAYDRPWHNHWLPEDVNGDDLVSPLDALLVIHNLNTQGGRELAVPPMANAHPLPLIDVSGDNLSSPLDALIVIRRLNAGPLADRSAEAEAEGNELSERAYPTPHTPSATAPDDQSWSFPWRDPISRTVDSGKDSRRPTMQPVDVFLVPAVGTEAALRRHRRLTGERTAPDLNMPPALPPDVGGTPATACLREHTVESRLHRRTDTWADACDQLFAQWPEDGIESQTRPLDSGAGLP